MNILLSVWFEERGQGKQKAVYIHFTQEIHAIYAICYDILRNLCNSEQRIMGCCKVERLVLPNEWGNTIDRDSITTLVHQVWKEKV